jgi:hypothetical protein
MSARQTLVRSRIKYTPYKMLFLLRFSTFKSQERTVQEHAYGNFQNVVLLFCVLCRWLELIYCWCIYIVEKLISQLSLHTLWHLFSMYFLTFCANHAISRQLWIYNEDYILCQIPICCTMRRFLGTLSCVQWSEGDVGPVKTKIQFVRQVSVTHLKVETLHLPGCTW